MDGRIQNVVAEFGKQKFEAKYPDTITEAGMAGLISGNPDVKFVENLKFKLLVSLEKHHSKGILIDGHQECAGNPVDDAQHKEDIVASVEFVKNLIGNKVPVVGVFVARDGDIWRVEEV